MKCFYFFIFFLVSFAGESASPVISVKERLRLNMWFYGLEDNQVIKERDKTNAKRNILPDEIEHILKKM